MPMGAAARRASDRSSGAQQVRPDRFSLGSIEYNRIATPAHRSAPRTEAVSAAATLESTPPDMAIIDSMVGSPRPDLRRAAFGRQRRKRRGLRLLGRVRLHRNPERHLRPGKVMPRVGLVLGR